MPRPRSLPAFCRFFFSFWKTVPVRGLERLVQHAREIAAVVLEAGGDLVRKLVLGNEVAAAELGRVHAELARGVVHQALERVGHDRAAGAAIGGHRRGVGEREADARVGRRHVVHAGQAVDDADGVDERPGRREVGAEVRQHVEAHAEDAAAVVERELAAASARRAPARRRGTPPSACRSTSPAGRASSPRTARRSIPGRG